MAALNFNKFNISVQVGYGSAKAHGFHGTPDEWEKVKHDYATQMVEQFGEDHRIDFNNLLISHDNWWEFPVEHQTAHGEKGVVCAVIPNSQLPKGGNGAVADIVVLGSPITKYPKL